MKITTKKMSVALSIACLVVASSTVYAQGIPVYDNLAFVDRVKTLANDIKKLKYMFDQLNEMQKSLKSVTGKRGYQNLMRNQMVRDYLPSDIKTVGDALTGAQSSYSHIGNSMKSISAKNAVLTAQDLDRMSPEVRDMVVRMRDNAAKQSAIADASYKNASENVARLQVLMDKIGDTDDPKSIAELQARISAEQTMIQNDAIKLAEGSKSIRGDAESLRYQIGERAAAMSGTSVSQSRVRITAPGQ